MQKTNPVVHFEMPSKDLNRMAEFYSKAFNWKTKQLGEDMGNYTLVTTTEVDEHGMPLHPGAINGGFYPTTEKMPEQHPSMVIAVDDISKSMKAVTDAGGKVLGEPMEIPGYGHYVSFYDTEGNRLSIMEPTMENKQKAERRTAETERR